MTSDIDTYRSANELIKQHGDAADIEAAMRADECLAAGDMEGGSRVAPNLERDQRIAVEGTA